jgi:TonB-linked SusC/RagA family outer membrane protein
MLMDFFTLKQSKMRKKLYLGFCALVFFTLSSIAQSITVTGNVTDEKGVPIEGATVVEKNSKKGTMSNVSGSFSLNSAKGKTLVVSSIGYETKEITVSDKGNLKISLKSSNQDLSEIVVTGAYNTKKTLRSATYNAQTVTSEQLNTIRQTDLNNALAGKVAGLQVRSQSGAALGRETTIRLRGASGFGGDQGAIYVVDGTILPSANDINPDDIEEVSVLQGPAAAAQFGSQGANGAIVITLKKAKISQNLGVSVNIGTQFDRVAVLPNYQNAYAGGSSQDMSKYTWQEGQPVEWKALDGKYYHNYEDDASWGPRMLGQEYIPWYAWYGGTKYSYKTANLNPQPNNARDFFNTGVTLNNSVSVSKATDNSSIRFSYGNISIKGILPTTSLQKHTMSLNVQHDVTNKLTFGANLNYVSARTYGQVSDDDYSNQSTGSFNQWFHRDLDMGIMKELRGLKTPEGVYASWNLQNPTAYDPSNPSKFYAGNYWYNFYTYLDLVKPTVGNDRLYGDLSLSYKITSYLKLKGTYRKQQNNTWGEAIFGSDLLTSGTQTTGNQPNNKGFYGAYNGFSNRENYELLLSFSKKIKDFQINANAGSDFFSWLYKDNSAATNNGLNVPYLYAISNSKDQPILSNNRIQEQYNGLYFTSSIGFRNYLFVDATVRKDWFSTLPADNNSVLAKSFGASFVFSDLVKIPALKYGKLRASWGEIPQALGLTSTTFGAYRYPGFAYSVGTAQWNGNFLMGTPNQLVDPNIKGAVKTQKEIGLDLRFFKDSKLGLSVTYWDGTEKDIPSAVTMNGASGFTSKLTNTGEISKKGLDLIVTAKPIWNKDIKWQLNATWGRLLENKVVAIAPGIDRTSAIETSWRDAPYLVHEVGQQWGMLYGNGIKRTAEGKPLINANGSYVNDPAVRYGNVLPLYTGGLQNSIVFLKNFTLNVNIDYQVGGKFFSLSDMWGSFSGLTARTATVNDKGNPIRDGVANGGGVRVDGIDATTLKASTVYVEAQDYFHGLYNNKTFDPFVYDLTFVKVRELSLGYSIPAKKIGIKGINKLDFSLVARSPFLIYAQTKDFDPAEISNLSGERGQFPATRSYGFNVKIGF